jgi:3-oxoadipate enol-lactonase
VIAWVALTLRAAPSFVALLALAACANGSPAYRGFGDVDYGYARERTFWSPRAHAEIALAELGPEDAGELPVLLLHPWGTNMMIWRDIAPRFAATRRVLLIDLPGHGKSGKPFGRYPIARLAAAARDALDFANVPRAIVVGNSIGGATSIELALRAPGRVAALVLTPVRTLVESTSKKTTLATLADVGYTLGWITMAPAMPPLAARMRDDAIALKATPEWIHWARATSSALREVVAYAPAVENVRAPALIVEGDDDRIVPPEYADALVARIPGAKLARLASCGHVPEVECPALLWSSIQPFVSAVE